MTTCLVCLEQIEFFAYHGFFDEEQKIGNRYSVDVTVSTDFLQAAQQDKLADTINYGGIYAIIKAEMEISARLLENLAFRMVNKIFHTYIEAREIEITIRKHNPPLGGVCAASKIVLKTDRKTWEKGLIHTK
jgi:dihydroneopterin aldolase